MATSEMHAALAARASERHPMSSQPSPCPHRADGGPVRVIVADEHPLVRAGLRMVFAQDPQIELVGEAADGEDLLALAAALRPDVLVMDLSLPGRQGRDLLPQLRACAPPTRLLILSACGEPEQVLSALRAGASSYVLKCEEPAAVVAAVHAAARGQTWLSERLAITIVQRAVHQAGPADLPALSPREAEVLSLLSEGKNNWIIAANLCISERTVRFHLRNIYTKLGMHRGEAIAWGARQQAGGPDGPPRRVPSPTGAYARAKE